MNWEEKLQALIDGHHKLFFNPPRDFMIRESVINRECLVSNSGALATWTAPESSGRSPKDTLIVKRAENADKIDWDSPNNIPMPEETFDMVMADALEILHKGNRIYTTDRVLGADSKYALPVRTVTNWALTALFTDNMFRPVPDDLDRSVFAENPFDLIVLPYNKLSREKYQGRLRVLPNGKTSDMVVAMDFERRLGIVFGSAYCGSVKKLMFTVMNYLLPDEGILPLHCSANEGAQGDCALLLGLSGTGKTTLSADPGRALLGDDEHVWSDDGIANFENGCYAKFIDISKTKEPEIYNAVMHKADYNQHGAIVENAMIYPWGEFDFFDGRFTQNSRASYPLSYLTNIKKSSVSGHPKTILFLTADANGVIPPVSKLTANQAMFWFLMGYTSKLAGTETGIVAPESTFSRFFGQPFMPRNPEVYASKLGDNMRAHGSTVYLVNTGWSGGPYGVGSRMDIDLTRAMVQAAISGALADVEYEADPIFKVHVPKSCPNVPSEILKPVNTWEDKAEYEVRAKALAKEFADHFEKAYGNKEIPERIAAECPVY